MITLETLEKWLNAPAETERLEFKEAKQQFDTTKLLRYCVALANEGGGYLALGVTDKPKNLHLLKFQECARNQASAVTRSAEAHGRGLRQVLP